ncbi:Lcl C-terminal domain-containing protein [Salinimonas lutimaris]|uniref:Lcl C-terminal domain-containing protein n=1 Tax=Salinimonas lutimaris TaxID=914153 RepID=UPI0010C0A545|nr:DUF1566 domain-containing protein [Salinimonas lutimaris]
MNNGLVGAGRKRIWQSSALLICTVLITACGGGGSDSSSTSLTVNAGADVQAAEQTTVFLSARSAGSDSELTYRWSVRPVLEIIQDDSSTGEASVVLPELEQQTLYTVTVTVSGGGQSDSDELIITALPENAAPVADIASHTASQEDGLYAAGIQITLSGAGSTDEDATEPTAPISRWQWQQLEGANVLQGVALDGPELTFTTPVASIQQQLRFALTVTDEEGAQDEATTTLLILPGQDTLPTADAGVSQGVFSGEPIILQGQADSSVSSAFPLLSRWEVSSASAVNIADDTALSTYAMAPAVTAAQTMTFTLTVSDANNNQTDDTITVVVRPHPTALMNDTGITVQASENAVSENQQSDYPGQDGQRGTDIIQQAGLLEKAGRGAAGFDFTKLNNNGDEQDADVTDFSCVRDNTTGLVWEVKTANSGLHGGEHTYGWFQTEENGGSDGVQTPSQASCAISECNTRAFVTAVRTEGLCGFYDWRMPTHFELMTLMHFGREGQTMVDPTYFPFAGDAAAAPLWYWTSQPGADGVIEDAAQNAWAIDFASGVDNFLNKGSIARVRLVRAGRE